MATLASFEELSCWRLAQQLAKQVYQLSRTGPLQKDIGLRDQLRRSSVSVAANIAEGFGRGGTKEFVSFLVIARGSAAEVRSHLLIAAELGYVSADRLAELEDLEDHLSRTITNLIRYLSSCRFKGRRYLQGQESGRRHPGTKNRGNAPPPKR